MLQLIPVGIRDKIQVVIVRVVLLMDADNVDVMVLYSLVIIVIVRQQILVLRMDAVIVPQDMELLLALL